ncbi:MAG TPA: KamA family radical SAM protein [Spirochaetota bacterium]|nr:KamA family radical SAM protein [Spirochaetota bacterium]HOL58094.1 KamA family radical SAM protein [Spirochaetota bacterium]HPP05174.1 KamA family radical SAM protein [Spirochaetota bacterium]
MKKLEFPEYYYSNIKQISQDHKKWNDYKWQLKNSYTSVLQLKNILKDIDSIEVEKKYNFLITPYFLSLIDFDNPSDPLRRQVFPNISELEIDSNLKEDPFLEKSSMPVKNVIKKYPDRVVIIMTNRCASFCRYCTRKWNWQDPFTISFKEIDEIHRYLEKEKNIREIILSGGDPFIISKRILGYALEKFSKIKHLEVIRIATRTLSFLPQIVDKEMTNLLKRYKPIWIITHFNHPSEITPLTEEAVEKLLDAGVAFANQSVLLKGINDNVETMKLLLNRLEYLRIKPYYLFQCDLISGTKHFRTKIEDGLNILKKLINSTGGLCIPHFIVDVPGAGKIPILPEYIIEKNDKEIFIKIEDRIVSYPLV